jgi:hypothetical protein
MYTTIYTTSPRARRSCPQEACAWELRTRSCCTPRNFRRHCIHTARHLESGEKLALSPLAYVLFSLLLPCDSRGPRLRPSNKPDLTWPSGSSLLPCWAVLARVDRARGARGPLTLRLAGTPERWIERNNKQPTGYPMYWWVPTDRPNLQLGSRKGTYCPKWEV